MYYEVLSWVLLIYSELICSMSIIYTNDKWCLQYIAGREKAATLFCCVGLFKHSWERSCDELTAHYKRHAVLQACLWLVKQKMWPLGNDSSCLYTVLITNIQKFEHSPKPPTSRKVLSVIKHVGIFFIRIILRWFSYFALQVNSICFNLLINLFIFSNQILTMSNGIQHEHKTLLLSYYYHYYYYLIDIVICNKMQ